MHSILAVDSKEQHLLEWKKVLSAEFKVIAVKSVCEAIKQLEDTLPDMILAALDMPEKSGLELMEMIQSKPVWSKIPVVISSKQYDAEMERLCFQKGAVEYLHDPIDGGVLLSRIKHSMELQHTRQRLEIEVLKKSLEIERKNAEMERQRFLVELSRYDYLTGALKREAAMKQINSCLSNQKNGVFLILDMDNFKAVNDTYGHIEGDKLLVRFSRTLIEESGKDAIVARIGGDEFIVFFGKCMSRNEIKKVASRIVEKVEQEIVSPGRLVKVTVSMGIANAPEDGRNFDELYCKADKALYYVKNKGKNDFHFFGENRCLAQYKKLTSTSLSDIRKNMEENVVMNGSYMVDYNSFEKIYRFVERNRKREQRQVQCVLFTLHEENLEEDRLQDAIKELGDVVVMSLRKGDVSTYYSTSQLLVLLMDTDKENATLVVERIRNQYYHQAYTDNLKLTYEIQTVTGELSEVTEVL